MTARQSSMPPLAVTSGEPAGIGPEITIKAWHATRREGPPFFFLGDPDQISQAAVRMGLATEIAVIARADEAAAAFPRSLPVLPEKLTVPVVPGSPDPRNANAVLSSIRRAVELVRAGEAGAVVTNPIHKGVLYEAGFRHPGHTEFLAELAGGGERPVMMLACPELRVVPVTVHLSLADAVKALKRTEIVACGEITAHALRIDFGIADPVLAVAGLNPHAGEGGHLGREEIEVIAPAIEELRAKGIRVKGPAPADTLFHPRARASVSAVLCMYHDQALIPLKTIDFDGGVNVTLGLPFVRTSPDHGTAFDIAGTGKANADSLIASLRMGADMAARRAAHAAR
ncbi:MAG: 4-hydroxythreonine-4-phosphate dehydrogenase PdxA [Alphaproteobacteria bacterium]|nr:4-hydroxythreonine-4-phosphate dehydrogenase PdxA [Alphaproteobacteria bacterium]